MNTNRTIALVGALLCVVLFGGFAYQLPATPAPLAYLLLATLFVTLLFRIDE